MDAPVGFRQLDDSIRRNIPEILIAGMTILHNKYVNTGTASDDYFYFSQFLTPRDPNYCNSSYPEPILVQADRFCVEV